MIEVTLEEASAVMIGIEEAAGTQVVVSVICLYTDTATGEGSGDNHYSATTAILSKATLGKMILGKGA